MERFKQNNTDRFKQNNTDRFLQQICSNFTPPLDFIRSFQDLDITSFCKLFITITLPFRFLFSMVKRVVKWLYLFEKKTLLAKKIVADGQYCIYFKLNLLYSSVL